MSEPPDYDADFVTEWSPVYAERDALRAENAHLRELLGQLKRAGIVNLYDEVLRLRAALEPLAEAPCCNDEFGQHCHFCSFSNDDYDIVVQHSAECPVLVARQALA